MSNAEHTPTPWFLWYSQAETCWTVQHSGGWIARMTDVEPVRPGRANAEFIVRACNSHADLLAALQAAVDYLSRLPPFPDRGVDVETVRLMGVSAIAKAEGR